MQSMPADAYDADPAAMELFLSKVRAEHGGVVEWARSSGIDADTKRRLEAKLLV